MAWASINLSKSDIARRTADGLKSIAFPSTGLTETRRALSGCSECSLSASHGPPAQHLGIKIPHGERYWQRVPAANYLDADSYYEIQLALFYLEYIHNGFIDHTILYNVGYANNATQDKTYQIISVSGATATIKGPNPKRLIIGAFRINPNWPLADPVTGETSRLISDNRDIALPLGSMMTFNHPSCLYNKARPLVIDYTPPASSSLNNVTFTVTLDQNIDEAMNPVDLKYPPGDGKYYCRIWFEAISPSIWAYPLEQFETQFSRQKIEFTTAAIHTLKDGDGNNTRILWPDMSTGAFECKLIAADESSTTLTDNEAIALLSTTDPAADSWQTTIDLSGETFARAVVTYWAESVSGDAERRQCASQCANSHWHPVWEWHCGDYTATEFANYNGPRCWKPVCDKFCLGDSSSNYQSGNMATPAPQSPRDASFLSSLWSRASWILIQGIPGISSHFNFSLSKAAGPSIQSILGGWKDEVPSGVFQAKDQYHLPKMGQRVTWTDGSDEWHAINTGAFYMEPVDHSGDGGTDYQWDAAVTSDPPDGALPTEVSGWNTKDIDGGKWSQFPYRCMGRTNVYSYSHGNESLDYPNLKRSSDETFLTNVNLALTDATLNADIQARFSGGRSLPSGNQVVTGVVESVTDAGGGVKYIMMATGSQYSSYTSNGSEVVYPSSVGGNVCQTHEGARIYSFANSRAFRGPDSSDRAQDEDLLWWDGKGFKISTAAAFAVAPAQVDYNRPTPEEITQYLNVDVNEIKCEPVDRTGVNEQASVYFDPTTAPYDDCGVAAGANALTRKIFNNPGGSPDPDYYPPDATFAAGEHYWYNPQTHGIRLSQAVSGVGGSATIYVVCYHRDMYEAGAGTKVIESSGTGYGVGAAADDDVTLVGDGRIDDFTDDLYIISGDGAVEWRLGPTSQAICIVVFFVGLTITDVKVRTSDGGALSSQSFTPNPGTLDYIKITKAGAQLTFDYYDDGGGNGQIIQYTFPADVFTNSSGFVSASCWDGEKLKFLGLSESRIVDYTGAGVLSIAVARTHSSVGYTQSYAKASANAIQSVTNISADDQAMTELATDARDNYTISGSDFVFTSETSGDRVKIIYAADVSPGSPPGRPPRAGGTWNFATFDGDEASTAVGENHSNWHDQITIFDPDDEFSATQGETVYIYRGVT